MEWDSKMTLWELPELEQNDAEANLSLDCSVDLKLGGLGDLGLVESWKEQRRASSAASSSKRQRAPSNSNQTVLCLVDDCKSDLSSCKEYHRRHKVCELHSKTPVVVVGGQEQRFCQQCSRFHLLMEFDEVKRSCRKRLDGHNRRRRKPQVEAINSGNLYSTQHASRFTSYPQNFQNARSDAAWTSMVKIEDDALYPVLPPPTNQFVDAVHQPPSHRFAAAFNPNYKEDEQFFLHDGRDIAHGRRMTLEPATVCQPLLNTISSTAESSSNNMMFSESQVFNSDCALSLLSSSAQSSGVNQSHMVPADRIPMGQPLLSNLRYGVTLGGYSPSPMEEEHVRTVLVPDSGEADLHCHSMFRLGDKGDSDCASESLPFSWQ